MITMKLDEWMVDSFSHGLILMADNFSIVLSSDFPDFLGFCMEVNGFKNILGIPRFTNGTAINLIDKEKEANYTHVYDENEDYGDSTIIINDDTCDSKRAKEHDNEPDDNSIEDHRYFIQAENNKYEVDKPVPDNH